MSDSYAQLYGSLWVDHFIMAELTRQRGDSAFTDLLCCIRTNSSKADDVKVLKSHEIAAEMANYPTQALHVYRLNAYVDMRNSLMLNQLASPSTLLTLGCEY